jgi:hypothetical protein
MLRVGFPFAAHASTRRLRMGLKAPVVFPSFGLFPDSFLVVASGAAVSVFLFVALYFLVVLRVVRL